MSQTPITVTYSLEEVLGEIKQSLKELDRKIEQTNQRFDSLQKDVNDFRTEAKVTSESLKGEIKNLSTEVKDINKRLDSQEFINRSIAVGILLAFATGIVKLFFPGFPNLPH